MALAHPDPLSASLRDARPGFLDLCGTVPPLRRNRGTVHVGAPVIDALLQDYSADVLFIELLHQFAVRSAGHLLSAPGGRVLPVSLARLRLVPLTGPVTLRSWVFPDDKLATVVMGGRLAAGPWRPFAVVRVAPVAAGVG